MKNSLSFCHQFWLYMHWRLPELTNVYSIYAGTQRKDYRYWCVSSTLWGPLNTEFCCVECDICISVVVSFSSVCIAWRNVLRRQNCTVMMRCRATFVTVYNINISRRIMYYSRVPDNSKSCWYFPCFVCEQFIRFITNVNQCYVVVRHRWRHQTSAKTQNTSQICRQNDVFLFIYLRHYRLLSNHRHNTVKQYGWDNTVSNEYMYTERRQGI